MQSQTYSQKLAPTQQLVQKPKPELKLPEPPFSNQSCQTSTSTGQKHRASLSRGGVRPHSSMRNDLGPPSLGALWVVSFMGGCRLWVAACLRSAAASQCYSWV